MTNSSCSTRKSAGPAPLDSYFMTMDTITSPRAFADLPGPVKTWLVSEQATGIIIALNKRLELDGDEIQIIPRLITWAVIGRLAPTQFIAQLQKELVIDFSDAKSIAQEILLRILKPVAVSLRNEGVDAALIAEGGPLQVQNSQSDVRRSPPEVRGPASTVPLPPPTPPAGDAPFILHREPVSSTNNEYPPAGGTNKRIAAGPAQPRTRAPITPAPPRPAEPKPPEIKPSFRYTPPQSVSSTEAGHTKPPAAPATARVETPRTVHYSGPTTKIGNSH